MIISAAVRVVAIACAGVLAGIYAGYRAGPHYALQAISPSAFVQFQQLQDTTTILHEHGFPHKRKRILQPRPADSILSNAVDDAKFHVEPTPVELELLPLPHRPNRALSRNR